MMTSAISHVFPYVTRRSSNSFKPYIFSFNVTGRRYCSTTDEKDSFENSKKVAKEDNPSQNVNKLTKSNLSDATKEAAKKKLLDLLADMKVSSEFPPKNRRVDSTFNLAKPLSKERRKEHHGIFNKKDSSPKDKMKHAIEAVASNLKGDPEKIQLELYEKLNSMNISKENLELEETEKDDKIAESLVDEEVSETIMSSVKDVASTVHVDAEPVQSELVKRLLALQAEGKIDAEQKTMLNLFTGLKVEVKEAEKHTDIALDQFRKTPQSQADKKRPRHVQPPKVNLFGSPPLNIFKLDEKTAKKEDNEVWIKLQENEMKKSVQFAPENAFEEMILWTEQGKHWKFPIDNEIDMGAEENVGFHEHVFLDHHLEGFPTKGPVRHFMELVVTGLSKNPYITVERKIENIEWFRQYFKEKEDILQHYGVLG